MKIAVLSVEPAQNDLICDALTSIGHECLVVDSGQELLHELRRDSADMLILDAHIADENAVELVAWVRVHLPPKLPVLLVADRTATADIHAALDAGINDYIISPVRVGELKTRTKILLQQAYPEQNTPEQIEFGRYIFEKHTGRLIMDGAPVDVTQKEFDLALLFFRNLGRPLSRAHIQEAVWGRHTDLPTRTMDTHVSRVRNKLQLRPEYGFRLTPVYSYGYQLEQV